MISEALDAVARIGLARVAELSTTGFDTNTAFNIQWMRRIAPTSRLALTSLGTQTEYQVAFIPNTGNDNYMHCILIVIGQNTLERKNWRKLTIARGDRGQMVVHPGWII